MSDAAKVAEKLHETYTRLAPAFGLASSGLPWSQLDDHERAFRTAAVAQLIGLGVIMVVPGWTP